MPVIKISIWIDLAVEECFDLARDISVHPLTVPHTKERAVRGVTEGHINEGERVTFEGVHFGVRQELSSRVQIMERPHLFVDVMEKGAFHSMTHVHLFEEEKGGTRMTDIIEFYSPLGWIGKLADKLFVEHHMKSFLVRRSVNLKRIGEGRGQG
ncbi:SRPBCC family protein [Halobacillus rhizosphaerae]|uniref:SRPBCC family protein n=1 Tax=Halobacillus rhizosphaerae TaxID=3064889 RepID=UPI00398AF787